MAFVFCATVAFASNGDPLKIRMDQSNLYGQPSSTQPCKAGDSQCVYCAACNGTTVCVYCSCGNCNPAWEALQTALCSLGCCQN